MEQAAWAGEAAAGEAVRACAVRLAELFASHRPRLEASARRYGVDPETAADLVQETFLRLLSAGMPEGLEAGICLVYLVIRRVAIDHCLKAARRRRLLERLLPEQLHRGTPPVDAAIQARHALRALDGALAELPPRTREVFLMRRVEGLGRDAVAGRLGISISAVEKHTAKAARYCHARVAAYLPGG